MQSPLFCWGKFRPLIAVGLLVLAMFLAIDAAFGMLLASHPDLVRKNLNWEALNTFIGGRLAELELLERDEKLDPDKLVLLIGQSSVREGFDPELLTENDPLHRRFCILGSSGLEMRALEATCIPLADSTIQANTVVVGFHPWMLLDEPKANYPAPSLGQIVHDAEHLRLGGLAADLANESSLMRYRKELGFLRKVEMFRLRLAISHYFNWPLTATFEPTDPWPTPAVNTTHDPETRFGLYIEAARQLRGQQFENIAPQVQSLRRTIERLRESGKRVVVMFMPEHSLLRNLVPPQVDIMIGRELAEIGGAEPIPVLDFRHAVPDDDFNSNSHVDNEGRRIFSTLFPEALAALSSDPAHKAPTPFAAPQLRLTWPLPNQVIQRSEGETAVAVRGECVGDLASAEVRWRRDDASDFSSWQELDIQDRDDCQGNIALPGVGWYEVEIRGRKKSDEAEMTDQLRFAVGEVFIIAGGDGAANLESDRHQASADVIAWRGNTWAVADDPQLMASGSGGSPCPIFGEKINKLVHAPVGIISIAEAGSAVADWTPSKPLFDRLRRALAAAGPNCVRAIVWDPQFAKSAPASTADMVVQLAPTIAKLKATSGCEHLKLIVAGGKENAAKDAQSADVRAGVWAAAVEDAAILPAQTP